MMTEALKELLRAFNAHAVEYLVVGGYAYGVRAEPRAPKTWTSSSRRMKKTAKPSMSLLLNLAPLSAV